MAEEAFNKHQSPIDIGRQYRYALIIASLNSVAKNSPPLLLAALVEKGLWLPAQALAFARQAPNRQQQVKSLAGLVPRLAETGHYQEALTAVLDIEQAVVQDRKGERDLEVVQDSENESELASTLIELARRLPRLPEWLKKIVYEIGQRNIRNKKHRAAVLTALAPHFSDPQKREVLHEALTVARLIGNKQGQAQALAALVPYFPEEILLEEALATAREIGHEAVWVEFLAGLGPNLPVVESLKTEAVEEVLSAVQEITDERSQARVLVGLAPHLLENSLLQKVLAAALAIESEQSKAKALAGLVSYLPETLLRNALQHWPEAIIDPEEDENQRWRASALARVGDYQPALAVARRIRHERWRVRTLTELSDGLPEPLKYEALQEALAVAQEVESEWQRAKLLAELIRHLRKAHVDSTSTLPEPEQVLEEALATVRGLNGEQGRANGLIELVPYARESLQGKELAATLVWEAIAVARGIENGWGRTKALLGLVDRLIEVGYPLEALALVRAIEDKDDQKKTLTALALKLMELGYPQEALAAAGKIEWEAAEELEGQWEQLAIEAGLTPRLLEPAKVERRLVKQVIKAFEVDEQTKTLTELALRLVELNHPQEALVAAETIGNEKHRTAALTELAHLLPEALIGKALIAALAAAQTIRNEKHRTTALTELVQLLPEELKGEALTAALAAARTIEDEWVKAQVLAELVPHLPKEQRDEVLKESQAAVYAIEDGWARAEAQAELASLLVELGFPRQGLDVAGKIRGDERAAWTQVQVLARLVSRLPGSWKEDVLHWILKKAQEIKIEEYLAKILVQVAPELPESLRSEALEAARTIVIEKYRVAALTALAPYLSQSLKQEALDEALKKMRKIKSSDNQAAALVKLAPYLREESLLQNAMVSARAIGSGRGEAKALVGLVPYLPRSLLSEVLVMAGTIETRKYRSEVLEVLASQLASLSQPDLIEWWLNENQGTNLLYTLSGRTRRNLLSDIHALVPVIAALGEAEALIEVAHAIQDVGRWWP